jgi:hypothetical protein
MMQPTSLISLAHGGILGLGENKVPFPLERFVLSGNNNLLIRGEQDIEAMSDWQNKVDVSQNKLADNEQVRLPQLQAQQ